MSSALHCAAPTDSTLVYDITSDNDCRHRIGSQVMRISGHLLISHATSLSSHPVSAQCPRIEVVSRCTELPSSSCHPAILPTACCLLPAVQRLLRRVVLEVDISHSVLTQAHNTRKALFVKPERFSGHVVATWHIEYNVLTSMQLTPSH